MRDTIYSEDRRIRRIALLLAIAVHLVAGGIALVVYLDEPDKQLPDRTVIILSIQPSEPARPPQVARKGQPGRNGRPAAPPVPENNIPSAGEPQQLDDLPVMEEQIPAIRKRFSTELLQSMSQEEAFDSLMVLLDEYPEFKETILKKMIAGKGIDRIPDLYVSTGIRDMQMKMKFRTKYEYEAMRQQFLYGPYNDPVNGPWGYKKTGPMVNVIELVSWLVDLIEGK